ncbi:MAG: tetratricopeptide repeat protein [Rhodospirillaceae bacterium]|nr:tetratricopeptide repeat protein [Rhodospirillaceae bacterium]
MAHKGKSGESGWAPPRTEAAAGPLQQAATLLRAGRLKEALSACESGLGRDPRNHRGHTTHGFALMHSGQMDAALAAFERACALASANVDYRINLGVALLNAGRPADAADQFRHVLARDARHAVALTNLGYALTLQKDYAAALDALHRAIEIEPARVEAHFNLGNAMRETGDRAGALLSFRRALELRPDMLPASINLAGLLLDGDDAAAARDVFIDAQRRHPDRLELQFGLALAHERLGESDAAISAYLAVLARWPDQRDALNNLAGLLKERGDEDAAIEHYEHAVALDPQSPEPAVNLASLYFKRHRRDEALRLLRKSMEHAVGRSELLLRIGNDLRALNDTDAAMACFRCVLDSDPGNVKAHTKLGIMLLNRDRLSAAREHLEFVLAIDGDKQEVLWSLAEIEQKLRHPTEATNLSMRSIEVASDRLEPRSNYLFSLNYSDNLSADEIAARHRDLVADWFALQPAPRLLGARSRTDRRLRIGYVSPDFRQHSCAYFFEPLLAAHDRDSVEIWCYSDVVRPDQATDRIRLNTEHWCEIAELDDESVAGLISDRDKVDVLIDLAGHTANGRLSLFARRAAPVQMSWLGYPNTTALPTMDYRLTDAIADPPGSELLMTERPIRIEGGFLAYRPAPGMPAIAEGPASRGAPPRFGCFNNAFKLTASTFALWATLLDRVPESRLVLRASSLRDPESLAALRRDLAAAGIDAERVEFPAYAPTMVEGLAGYADIDVALDPTPYNGTTTSCEALWMGVPVVTLAGDRHAARVGASLLHHAGLPELIADTPSRYVEIAAGLATDPARLAGLRATLRPQLASSPLGDARRLAAAFEREFARAFDAALATAAA